MPPRSPASSRPVAPPAPQAASDVHALGQRLTERLAALLDATAGPTSANDRALVAQARATFDGTMANIVLAGLSPEAVQEIALTSRDPRFVEALALASTNPVVALNYVAEQAAVFDTALIATIVSRPNGIWAFGQRDTLAPELARQVLDAAAERMATAPIQNTRDLGNALNGLGKLVRAGGVPHDHPIHAVLDALLPPVPRSGAPTGSRAQQALDILVHCPDCAPERLIQWLRIRRGREDIAAVLAHPNRTLAVLRHLLATDDTGLAAAAAFDDPGLLEDHAVERAMLDGFSRSATGPRAIAGYTKLCRLASSPEQFARRFAAFAARRPAEAMQWLGAQSASVRAAVDPALLQPLLMHPDATRREEAVLLMGCVGPRVPARGRATRARRS